VSRRGGSRRGRAAGKTDYHTIQTGYFWREGKGKVASIDEPGAPHALAGKCWQGTVQLLASRPRIRERMRKETGKEKEGPKKKKKKPPKLGTEEGEKERKEKFSGDRQKEENGRCARQEEGLATEEEKKEG